MKLKNMYVNDLLALYPYAGEFFTIFGLKLNSEHIKLNSYLNSLNKNFFQDIGIEKSQLLEHFQYFILCAERLRSKQNIAVH